MSAPAKISRLIRSHWFWPVLIAAAAFAAIVVALDPTGDHPGFFDGPGLTVDEGFNVGQGAQLADRFMAGDLAGFRKIDARLPDHPPLGRIWIGLCHELAYLIWPPVDLTVPYSITCARTGPAAAFAVLLVVVGVCAGRWYGRLAGAVTPLALVLMPRVFGHAHLAALETFVDLACTSAVLYLAAKWTSPSPSSADAQPAAPLNPDREWKRMLIQTAIGGLLFGLALLTKVQAVLLPIPVALWALITLRWRALPRLALWGVTGGLVFLLFWPHLWDFPVAHVREYLGRTTDRATLYVWYLGQSLADRDVPWHYPWVMFLTTVPVGLHVAGFCGLFGPEKPAWRSPREGLLLVCLLFPLVVFSVPGVAVYDGERLFSQVFPLWALFIGRGAEALWHWLARRFSNRLATISLAALLAAQGYGLWSMAPCWLSYYNLAAGGLPGAAKRGLEISYWGDGVTRELLARVAEIVPENSQVAVAPTLHAAQWQELLLQTPALRQRNIELVPDSDQDSKRPRYLLYFMRPEYLPEELRAGREPDRILAAVRRQGVLLAALIERPVP
jgi:hypothetical protein